MKYAFFELGVNRVELETFSFNRRAIRCFEKAGFCHEGTRRQALYRDGRYHDILIMGILKEEFSTRETVED